MISVCLYGFAKAIQLISLLGAIQKVSDIDFSVDAFEGLWKIDK